ncbi:MAG: cytochrome bc complex cytochrome b subunit, partial [Vicinamibacterales bacterium]
MKTVLAWLNDRAGWNGPIRSLMRYPVPAHAHHNPMFSMGSLLVILFLLQAVTGMLMAFYYDPSPEGAYGSVDYIQFTLKFGWMIRGIHHWAASLMVILVVLHLLRTYLYGAYKRPRELTWLFGVGLFFIVVSFGFTGYLLPWDQKGYWATQVGTEIAGSVPVMGDWLRSVMRGGEEMGIATITRFYATHMLVLPAAFVMLSVAHIALMRRNKLAPPLIRKSDEPEKTVPFYPTHLAIEAVIALAVVVGLIFAASQFPAPLDLR